jgi:hypothetical protein
LLLTPNDEAGFIAATEEIARDATHRAEMRNLARETALKNSWNIILSRTEEIFRSLVQINSAKND